MGCDSTNRFADVDLAAGTQVASVAFSAYAIAAAAGQDAADLDFIIILGNFLRLVCHDFFVKRHDDFACIFVDQCFRCRTAFNPVFQRFDNAITFYDGCDIDATDIVVTYFYFRDITAQDAVDCIFCERSASRAYFCATGVDDGFFDRFAEHIFNHSLAQGSTDAFFRRTKIDIFNDIGVIHIIIDVELAAMER